MPDPAMDASCDSYIRVGFSLTLTQSVHPETAPRPSSHGAAACPGLTQPVPESV